MTFEDNEGKLKGQTGFEYILLLAGVLVIIALITILVRGGIFQPAQEDINQSVATIKGFASALK